MAGRDDAPHFIGLLDDDHRLASQAARQDRGFDIATIFVAIADQQRFWIFQERKGDQQFGFAASLQAEVPTPAGFDQLLDDMALLVAFDRKHPLVAAAVAVLGDGPLEGGMQALQPVFEDVIEADQQRQGEIAPLQLLHQVHQIQGAAPIAAGLDHHMAAAANGEIGVPPAVETIEGGPIGGAPAGRGEGGGRGAVGVGEHHQALGWVELRCAESSQRWSREGRGGWAGATGPLPSARL